VLRDLKVTQATHIQCPSVIAGLTADVVTAREAHINCGRDAERAATTIASLEQQLASIRATQEQHSQIVSRCVKLVNGMRPVIGLQFSAGDTKQGITVTSARARSPARLAGLRSGDIIEAMNGRPTITAADFQQVTANVRPGTIIACQVIRKPRDSPLRAITITLLIHVGAKGYSPRTIALLQRIASRNDDDLTLDLTKIESKHGTATDTNTDGGIGSGGDDDDILNDNSRRLTGTTTLTDVGIASDTTVVTESTTAPTVAAATIERSISPVDMDTVVPSSMPLPQPSTTTTNLLTSTSMF
jgi:membrane-associated protease RseP (regulator of RpoE activity)